MATQFTPGTYLSRDARSTPIHWRRFADGYEWELVQGVDFEQEPEKARKAAVMWGHRNNHHCSSRFTANSVIVRFTPKGH